MFAPIAGMAGVTDFDVGAKSAPPVADVNIGAGFGSESDKHAFAALMEPVQHGPTALSALEKFANFQKMEMSDNLQSMRDFSAASPYLSMAESAGFGMEMSLKMTMTSAHFQVATNVGKNAGKGIDTLMRNQ